MRKILTSCIMVAVAVASQAHEIDFDQIKHWTGTGPNRAALAIQFNNETSGSLTRVWGYRWEDGETPNGEQMFKAIASDTKTLVLFTQFTGVYGSTVCGIGYDQSGDLLRTITFDFEGAKECDEISFDYYSINSFMGQNEAPGDDTPELAQNAIDAALFSRVIQHPIDQKAYGYPAYDYDFWQPDEDSEYYNPDDEWRAGWYYGYWSYWTGSESNPDLGYSGVGYSGHQLANGGIEGWSYSDTASIGEGVPPGDEGVEYVIDGEIVLADGTPYRFNTDVNGADVVYTRTFAHDGWHALYVPFTIDYEEWEGLAEIAEFSGVCEIDGAYVLEFTTLQSGCLNPHTPYIIKPKVTGNMRIEAKATTLKAVPSTAGSVSQLIDGNKFTLYGVYEATANLNDCYALKDGVFMKGSSDETTLSPYRIYLEINSPLSQALPAKCVVRVNDKTTSAIEGFTIETVDNDIYYDLTGRPVNNPTSGFYIKDGQKILIK